MIRQHVIQRGTSQFWTGHDWADTVSEAVRLTMDEGLEVIDRLAAGSPNTLHLVKDYGTAKVCVLCTA